MYACLSLGAQLVTNDNACKIPEDEWLRMYHYIVAKWELVRKGSFLTCRFADASDWPTRL